ncbi:hypothetical protein CAEBREN_02591 [Caenorhabditis brenneri]|uniref:RING-type domain-containing protein n=1 Tax=Caenorhabditis brenneri TaxID=135651 RepID=G0N9N3_CAEBE|nr:hypothetical protein CAEBREN_02591 [Caenorhabditis brenneri]
MSVWCPICNKMIPCEEAVQVYSNEELVRQNSEHFQLIPCLHTFCKNCLKESSKQTKLCPVAHCYSSLSAPEIMTSTCEGENCQRKITINADILRTACHHDVCQHCYDMASRKEKMSCPAAGCSESMVDEDEMICEGPCKQPLVFDRTIVIPCCGARMCDECGPKWTNGREFCDSGKCVIKESTKRKKTPDTTRQPCTGSKNCGGEVLRNFPSEFECEHDVCVQCIGSMLDECEKNGKSPMCPSKSCGIPYRCESVLALAAQFPERKTFFSKFKLQAKFSMQTLRDDIISNVIHGDLNTMTGQKFTLKIGQCDDDDGGMPMEFVRSGSLGDLIREVRRVLKILATDKIYGYYRVDNGKTKMLDVTKDTIRSSCSVLNITENTTILVDTTGIVAKSKKH